MTYNDILRRVRYILNAPDQKLIEIFAQSNHQVSKEQVKTWLLREGDPDYIELKADELALFLDGLIIELRGPKEEPKDQPKDGPKITYKQHMNNNLILVKLKIAFNLKSDDVLELMKLANFKISPHELSALFRKKDHKHYRVCKNQMLRKFMKGLQIKYRGNKQTSKPETKKPEQVEPDQTDSSKSSAIWTKTLNKHNKNKKS